MKMATKLMLMENQKKKENGQYETGHGYRDHMKGQRRFDDEQEAMHYGHEPGFGDDRGEIWPNMRKPHGPDPLYGKRDHGSIPRKGHDEDYEREMMRGQKKYHDEDDEEEEDRGHHGNKGHGGKIDEWQARKWVSSMQDGNGKHGEHYTPDKATMLMEQHCPECDRWEWYIAINMMHSDYGDIAKKLGVDCDMFCSMLAKAFLEDEDAGPEKVKKYMEAIPKK